MSARHERSWFFSLRTGLAELSFMICGWYIKLDMPSGVFSHTKERRIQWNLIALRNVINIYGSALRVTVIKGSSAYFQSLTFSESSQFFSIFSYVLWCAECYDWNDLRQSGTQNKSIAYIFSLRFKVIISVLLLQILILFYSTWILNIIMKHLDFPSLSYYIPSYSSPLFF